MEGLTFKKWVSFIPPLTVKTLRDYLHVKNAQLGASYAFLAKWKENGFPWNWHWHSGTFSWTSISGSLVIYKWQSPWLPVTHWEYWPTPDLDGRLALSQYLQPWVTVFQAALPSNVVYDSGKPRTQTQKQSNKALLDDWKADGVKLLITNNQLRLRLGEMSHSRTKRSGNIWQLRQPTSDLKSVWMHLMSALILHDTETTIRWMRLVIKRIKAALLIDLHKEEYNSLQMVLSFMYDGALL